MKPIYKPGLIPGVCSIVLACSACTPNGAESDRVASVPTDTEDAPQSESGVPAVDLGEEWTGQVSDAVADLAGRTGVSQDSITVRSARSVTWADSALGCPQPGMSYTETLQDGLRVVLEAEGIVYYYHGKNGAALIYCPAELAKAPAYGPGEEIM